MINLFLIYQQPNTLNTQSYVWYTSYEKSHHNRYTRAGNYKIYRPTLAKHFCTKKLGDIMCIIEISNPSYTSFYKIVICLWNEINMGNYLHKVSRCFINSRVYITVYSKNVTFDQLLLSCRTNLLSLHLQILHTIRHSHCCGNMAFPILAPFHL